MTLQWQGLLQNLGTWQGSFTQLSPKGVQLENTLSELTLSLSADEKTVDLLLKRDSCRDIALQFQYPGPGPQIPFFESGCFSQGSLQWSPYSSFGAEFALIHGDRRLRLVQLYNPGTDPSSLTLIRESRAGSGATESPPLQVSDLLGTWEGEAISLYPDARHSDPYQTHLQVEQIGDRLTQSLQFGNHRIQTSAQIDGNRLHFSEGAQPMQLLCLAGGASALGPQQIQPRTPFVFETGWLVEPNLRKRMVRSYGDKGEWASITVVTERKIN